jgi:O-glycosyl hydrolase
MMAKLKVTLVSAIILFYRMTTAGEVSIDSTARYQTIEGLGVAMATHVLGLHNNAELIKTLSTDLGISMLRLYPEPNFEKENDNDDPSVIDWSKFDFVGEMEDGPAVQHQLEILEKFKSYEIPRVILSVFSPAGWMKTNGSIIGGKLKTDMYEEFAEYYTAYIQGIKDSTGIDVYAISPQNEPRWEQWYDSCVYTFSEMRDIIKVLGNRFENDGIDTKIFAAEDLMGEDWIPWTQPWVEYYDAIMADPVAANYFDVLAVHTYEDGILPSSPSADVWKEVFTAADTVGKSVWMTETSGYQDWYDDGLSLAQAIYSALYYGNCTSWVWLNAAMNRSFQPETGLIIYEFDRKITYPPKYYMAKQYFRFIRPGAVRIGSTSDDADVYSLAFINPVDNSMTVILINQSENLKALSLKGMRFPQFKAFRTSEEDRCTYLGLITDSLTLPPKSVTTLYSGLINSINETGVLPDKFELKQNFPNPFNPSTTVEYTLTRSGPVTLNVYNVLGQRVRSLVSENQTPGDYSIVWNGTDANDWPLSSGLYFYRLCAGDHTQVRKMMLVK